VCVSDVPFELTETVRDILCTSRCVHLCIVYNCVQFFDMRMLFLLTALCTDVRSVVHSLTHSLASFVFDHEELFSVQLNADRSSCYFGTVVYKYFCDVLQLQITLSKSIFKIFVKFH